MRFCDYCQDSQSKYLCSGCHKSYYCSKICQKNDWDNHKQVCNNPILIEAKTKQTEPTDIQAQNLSLHYNPLFISKIKEKEGSILHYLNSQKYNTFIANIKNANLVQKFVAGSNSSTWAIMGGRIDRTTNHGYFKWFTDNDELLFQKNNHHLNPFKPNIFNKHTDAIMIELMNDLNRDLDLQLNSLLIVWLPNLGSTANFIIKNPFFDSQIKDKSITTTTTVTVNFGSKRKILFLNPTIKKKRFKFKKKINLKHFLPKITMGNMTQLVAKTQDKEWWFHISTKIGEGGLNELKEKWANRPFSYFEENNQNFILIFMKTENTDTFSKSQKLDKEIEQGIKMLDKYYSVIPTEMHDFPKIWPRDTQMS